MINGPVIVIEDDEDDRDIFREAFKFLNYPNKIIFFNSGLEAYKFLSYTKTIPFLILSDINMPVWNGFDLKKKINDTPALKEKCIPYLFFSTGISSEMIITAYTVSAQGYFFKGNSMSELIKTLTIIMEYWKICAAPSRAAC